MRFNIISSTYVNDDFDDFINNKTIKLLSTLISVDRASTYPNGNIKVVEWFVFCDDDRKANATSNLDEPESTIDKHLSSCNKAQPYTSWPQKKLSYSQASYLDGVSEDFMAIFRSLATTKECSGFSVSRQL